MMVHDRLLSLHHSCRICCCYKQDHCHIPLGYCGDAATAQQQSCSNSKRLTALAFKGTCFITWARSMSHAVMTKMVMTRMQMIQIHRQGVT